jgi:DNA-binding CsgD family transcriptional regulator
MDGIALTAAFSTLVARIYDCAVDNACWPATLDAVRRTLGCANAALSLQLLPSGQLIKHIVTGVPSPWLEQMPAYHADILDLWGGLAFASTVPLDRAAVLSRTNPDALAAGTNRYLVEWKRPQGLVDTLAIPLTRDGASIGAIGMGRHSDAGPIDEAEIALATLLTPHLQRAVAIGRLLDTEAANRNTLEAVIDRLAMPVFVVADDRAILHRNAAAERLAPDDSGIVVRGGRLSSPRPSVAHALDNAVRQCRSGIAPGHHALGLPCHDAAGRTRALHVLPLGDRGLLTPLLRLPRAAAVVFVAMPRAAAGASAAMVATLFALTPMETRVFGAIADGATVAATAQRLGTATSTIRTHLLKVFDKTGLRRQPELVRLANSLTLPIEAG